MPGRRINNGVNQDRYTAETINGQFHDKWTQKDAKSKEEKKK